MRQELEYGELLRSNWKFKSPPSEAGAPPPKLESQSPFSYVIPSPHSTMAAIGPDEIRTLEQMRQRLQTLNGSLSALLTNFYEVQPLPTWCDSPVIKALDIMA